MKIYFIVINMLLVSLEVLAASAQSSLLICRRKGKSSIHSEVPREALVSLNTSQGRIASDSQNYVSASGMDAFERLRAYLHASLQPVSYEKKNN